MLTRFLAGGSAPALRLTCWLLAGAAWGGHALAALRVPAFTVYLDLHPDGASVTRAPGISNWANGWN